MYRYFRSFHIKFGQHFFVNELTKPLSNKTLKKAMEKSFSTIAFLLYPVNTKTNLANVQDIISVVEKYLYCRQAVGSLGLY